MKVLSGRQPWWWAILHAGKRVENRSRKWAYRGPILLHAAKGCTHKEYLEARRWMEGAGVLTPRVQPMTLDDMPRGGIVGRARIVDVIPPHSDLILGGKSIAYPPGVDGRWHMLAQWGYVLSDVEPLPFTPCRGFLGLFDHSRVLTPEQSRALGIE